MAPTGAAQVLAPRVRRALHQIGSPRVTMAEVRAFIALADAGAYVGASIITCLSQSSLHRPVRDLSVEPRRNLVSRRGPGLALSDAGCRTAPGFPLASAELRSERRRGVT